MLWPSYYYIYRPTLNGKNAIKSNDIAESHNICIFENINTVLRTMIMDNKEIKFKYIFDDDYNPVYINGAHGGINFQGEIIVNFYLERFGLPNTQTQEVTPEGKLGDVIDSSPKDVDRSHIRYVKNGVIMNLHTAKTIYQWLGNHIENLEKLQNSSKQ